MRAVRRTWGWLSVAQHPTRTLIEAAGMVLLGFLMLLPMLGVRVGRQAWAYGTKMWHWVEVSEHPKVLWLHRNIRWWWVPLEVAGPVVVLLFLAVFVSGPSFGTFQPGRGTENSGLGISRDKGTEGMGSDKKPPGKPRRPTTPPQGVGASPPAPSPLPAPLAETGASASPSGSPTSSPSSAEPAEPEPSDNPGGGSGGPPPEPQPEGDPTPVVDPPPSADPASSASSNPPPTP